MTRSRGKFDSRDGVIIAQLMGAASRWAEQDQIHTEAAIAELTGIAGGRADLLAEGAGLLIGFRRVGNEDVQGWPMKAVAGALLIAAGADITVIGESIREALRRARE